MPYKGYATLALTTDEAAILQNFLLAGKSFFTQDIDTVSIICFRNTIKNIILIIKIYIYLNSYFHSIF